MIRIRRMNRWLDSPNRIQETRSIRQYRSACAAIYAVSLADTRGLRSPAIQSGSGEAAQSHMNGSAGVPKRVDPLPRAMHSRVRGGVQRSRTLHLVALWSSCGFHAPLGHRRWSPMVADADSGTASGEPEVDRDAQPHRPQAHYTIVHKFI